jgi:hypothetical protein
MMPLSIDQPATSGAENIAGGLTMSFGPVIGNTQSTATGSGSVLPAINPLYIIGGILVVFLLTRRKK